VLDNESILIKDEGSLNRREKSGKVKRLGYVDVRGNVHKIERSNYIEENLEAEADKYFMPSNLDDTFEVKVPVDHIRRADDFVSPTNTDAPIPPEISDTSSSRSMSIPLTYTIEVFGALSLVALISAAVFMIWKSKKAITFSKNTPTDFNSSKRSNARLLASQLQVESSSSSSLSSNAMKKNISSSSVAPRMKLNPPKIFEDSSLYGLNPIAKSAAYSNSSNSGNGHDSANSMVSSDTSISGASALGSSDSIKGNDTALKNLPADQDSDSSSVAWAQEFNTVKTVWTALNGGIKNKI
jgi:hypothetical protein